MSEVLDPGTGKTLFLPYYLGEAVTEFKFKGREKDHQFSMEGASKNLWTCFKAITCPRLSLPVVSSSYQLLRQQGGLFGRCPSLPFQPVLMQVLDSAPKLSRNMWRFSHLHFYNLSPDEFISYLDDCLVGCNSLLTALCLHAFF